MIYSPDNRPVEIVSDTYHDLLDPTSVAMPFVDVRYMGEQERHRARLGVLHADGGQTEIEACLRQLREGGKK